VKYGTAAKKWRGYPSWQVISIIRTTTQYPQLCGGFSDVSKSHKRPKTICFLLRTTTSLTGLPSVSTASTKSAVIAEKSSAVPGVPLLFLDIDRLSNCSTMPGHHTGDSFCNASLQRLAEACPKNGTVVAAWAPMSLCCAGAGHKP